jgi:hypothetical protein
MTRWRSSSAICDEYAIASPPETALTDDKPKLHSAEHRAYRELYASARHLTHRWARIGTLLEDTAIGERLQRGAADANRLLQELPPRTEAYGLYGTPMAQNVGARLADLRTGIADRGGDTGMVARFSVLDGEHLTTLLRQLAELARARGDRDMAGFCEEWAMRFEPHLDAVRQAAIELGNDPDRAAAPVADTVLNKAAHGVGWTFGAFGEGVDQIAGRLRRR